MTTQPARASDFRSEFPDFDPATLPAIPAGFVDTSWHNDACPSFTDETLRLVIYVNPADPASREVPDSKRFVVAPQDAEAGDWWQDTDDWTEVLAFVERTRAEVQAQCQHRDTGRGVCADCGAFLPQRD